MSTLPFLLSVADELDNLNSQSYMDDFGLGFHPHRQYYRSPTIQLSLPASTDWMQEQHRRCRTHKFYDESQNNLQETAEEEGGDDYDTYVDRYGSSTAATASTSSAAAAAAAASNRQKYTSALNSNLGNINNKAAEDDNIDNSVRMYNLSKKCCKNYYKHDTEQTMTTTITTPTSQQPLKDKSTDGYKLHSKCFEGNNSSSSDESLQKVTSSIEFLTCFLLKKSRASSKNNAGSAGSAKKS